MKKTLVLAVSALAFVSSSAFAADAMTNTNADASTTTSADASAKPMHKKMHHTKKVHKAHVAKKGDASPEESSTR